MEGHNGSILYYPVAILIGFFPWSVFAGPTLIGAVSRVRRRDPWYPGYVFASCWICVYIGVFSLAQTKLPSYVTPCYPALALLTGCFIYQWARGEAAASRLWPRLSIGSLALVGVAMMIALPLAANRYLPGEGWLGAIGLIPLVGAIVCLVSMETGRMRTASTAFAATAVAFTTVLFGFAVMRVGRHQQNHVLLAAIEQCGESPRVGAFGCLEPTWVYYGGRPINELTLDASDPTSTSQDAWQPKPRLNAADFFASGEDRFIITTARHWEPLRAALPAEAKVLAECPLFLKDDRLLLIGVKRPVLQTANRKNTLRK
jgi:4-amino-4-deoxy-L-arabinose transferase-like glycosyltransferase